MWCEKRVLGCYQNVWMGWLFPVYRLVRTYRFSNGFSAVVGLAAPKSPSQVVNTETSISAGFSNISVS